jgi:uncharacterized protein YndB with AHSA1/START domain
MVASGVANSETFQVTLPSDHEIRMTRLFDAPRRLVFEALTKPEHIVRWWGRLGEGYSVPVCEMDARVGGSRRFVNRHPKGDAAFHGVVRELIPQERIVYTEIYEAFPDVESVVTAILTDEGGKTRLTVTVQYPSKEVRDAVQSTGMERGAAISYDWLEKVATELRGAIPN